MANDEHVDLLKQGPEVWNAWRQAHPEVRPDLRQADLRGAVLSVAPISWEQYERTNYRDLDRLEEYFSDEYQVSVTFSKQQLEGVDLRDADLSDADLRGSVLIGARLRKATLRGARIGGGQGSPLASTFWPSSLLKLEPSAKIVRADFCGADLRGAHLRGADLRGQPKSLSFLNLPSGPDFSGADMSGLDLSALDLNGALLARTNLTEADLSQSYLNEAYLRKAILRGANLRKATLVDADLAGADLTGCSVFGLSAWKLNLNDANQSDLVISDYDEPMVTVDNLEIAQFAYLLLNNKKLRGVIDSISSKGVLILGRFTPERKSILDALREKLRSLNYLPMMFDFARPSDRDLTETIMTLAGMCRFVIADITNPRSSPLELQATVPNFMIPFVPILQEGEEPFAMFKDLYGKYDWVLIPLKYPNEERLVEKLEEAVVNPALEKYRELALRKAAEMPTRSL